jgi:hypothetical protein
MPGKSCLDIAVVSKDHSIKSASEFKRIMGRRTFQGIVPAIRDPETGDIYTGSTTYNHAPDYSKLPYMHRDIFEEMPKVVQKRVKNTWEKIASDDAGFLDENGKFWSRNQVEVAMKKPGESYTLQNFLYDGKISLADLMKGKYKSELSFFHSHAKLVRIDLNKLSVNANAPILKILTPARIIVMSGKSNLDIAANYSPDKWGKSHVVTAKRPARLKSIAKEHQVADDHFAESGDKLESTIKKSDHIYTVPHKNGKHVHILHVGSADGRIVGHHHVVSKKAAQRVLDRCK